jgi:hypothetical protein
MVTTCRKSSLRVNGGNRYLSKAKYSIITFLGLSEINGGFSVHGQSTMRTENALSEIESALSGKNIQSEILNQNFPLSSVFFQTAEILIDLGCAEDADKCLDEVQKLMSG